MGDEQLYPVDTENRDLNAKEWVELQTLPFSADRIRQRMSTKPEIG